MTTYFVYKYLTVLNKNTAPYINAVNDHHHHQQQKQEQHQSGDVKVSMSFASRKQMGVTMRKVKLLLWHWERDILMPCMRVTISGVGLVLNGGGGYMH